MSETQKKFAQFQEDGKFWYGMLDKDLSVEDSAELRDAFELDKQKDLKKEATKGNWLCKTGKKNKELLREIHEHAIKVQSKIAKELEKKVMKPVKDNQFAKVSRNHPFHYCLAFVSSVRQHPLAKMLTRHKIPVLSIWLVRCGVLQDGLCHTRQRSCHFLDCCDHEHHIL